MRPLFVRVNAHLVTCSRCYGMGVRELPNGETIECANCKGIGYLK